MWSIIRRKVTSGGSSASVRYIIFLQHLYLLIVSVYTSLHKCDIYSVHFQGIKQSLQKVRPAVAASTPRGYIATSLGDEVHFFIASFTSFSPFYSAHSAEVLKFLHFTVVELVGSQLSFPSKDE